MTHAACVPALLLVLAALPAQAAAPVTLAAHHARYELTLASVQGGSTVAASGSMTYQVIDACNGWATQQQLRLRTVSRDGGATDLVSDYATLEAKDGRHLTFKIKQIADGTVAEQVSGEAMMRASGGGRIRYTLPHPEIVALPPGTLFPMAHTAAIIRSARGGQKSLSVPLFDGTGTDGAQDTYVTILGWHAAPSASDHPALAALGSSRVIVAFFARGPQTITPDYASTMRYFDNGVADHVLMDFGGFTMRATLTNLVIANPAAHC
ncbi:EipB family protein [Lichenicoccus sp.]|uniref:EipB family protein n=1 Tax=Lichenicoccus sp. TaxID=2781899 RepID=UPI003D0BDE9A